jgi:heme/copper-type cytochrome/quinol oxidase subunit 3
LSLKNLTILLKKNERENQKALHSINSIIFWGFLSAIFGLFAHFYGVYLAMQAIARASDVSPAIVAKGYAYSLVTILTGMTIFMSSGILWFALRFVAKKKKIS